MPITVKATSACTPPNTNESPAARDGSTKARTT